MNNSFDFVSRCLLNNSASKQTHAFNKASRFPNRKPPPCSQSAYDLNKFTLAASITPRTTILSRDSRFKSSATDSPSPNAYQHRSFVDLNRSVDKGAVFNKAPKTPTGDKKALFPGPSDHSSTYNPQKRLSYTMRCHLKEIDHRPKVGPGQYNVQDYHALHKPFQVSSKFTNPKNAVLGTSTRFYDKQFLTPSPGPSAYSRVRTEGTQSGLLHRFGGEPKKASYIKKSTAPGPGSYNKFSQFSELKGSQVLGSSRQ